MFCAARVLFFVTFIALNDGEVVTVSKLNIYVFLSEWLRKVTNQHLLIMLSE